MSLILKNISQLYRIATENETCKKGTLMQDAALLENAYILCKEGRIVEVGEMLNYPKEAEKEAKEIIDCTGRIVFPGFVDSHTHIVFPKTREEEYVYKIKGMKYEEIAAKGGGILNSARATATMSEEELLESALKRCLQVLATGTTTLEIKSGYGLSLESELKLLRVANQLKKHTPQRIKSTFLGAHAFPEIYKTNRAGYIDLICKEMIPAVAEEKLADFIDVFCETGFFTEAESEKVLQTGLDYGLIPKLHANQLDYSGGVKLGVKLGAISVDHLERCADSDILALQNSQTVPTLLPSCSFFLRDPYAPARQLINANLPIALATDYNPGSSPSGSMPFVIALACTYMRLLPEEALVAATINGANALGLSHEVGSIEVGKRADFIITKPLENLARLPYSFTENLIERVVCG